MLSDKDDKPQAPFLASSLYCFMAGNVKESTHFSQKGPNVAPGVVVWPCCCLYRHYSNQPSSEAEQGKKINEVNISGLSDCRETLVTQRGRILVVYLIALTNEPLFVIVTIIIIFFNRKKTTAF